MRRVVLASGGIDSFIMWWLFCRNDLNVFVDVGQKYLHKEMQAVRNLKEEIKDYRLVEVEGAKLGKCEDEKTGIIPNRNAELILNASLYGQQIYFGVLKEEIEENDNTSDKSQEFVDAVVEVLNISNRKQYWTDGKRYEVLLPTIQYNKTQLVQKYLNDGGSPDHLSLTVSCYSITEKPCGECSSCFNRYVAFTNNDIPLDTIKDPVDWAKKMGIVQKCLEGGFTKERNEEIRSALKL